MIPILAVECSYAEFPQLKAEADLHKCAKDDQEQVPVSILLLMELILEI